MVTHHSNGTITRTPDEPKAAPAITEAHESRLIESRWKRDLPELRTLVGHVVLPMLIDDRAWFIKRLSKTEMDMMGSVMSSKGFSILDLDDNASRTLFLKSLVLMGTCVGYPNGTLIRYPEGGATYLQSDCNNTQRYFSELEDVEELWDEEGMSDIPNTLAAQLLLHVSPRTRHFPCA